MKENLSASMEDYIEAISRIMAEKQAVRAKDIAERLNVTRPSVSGALRTLVKSGLIDHVPYDVITLTNKGALVAKDIIHRHESLREFFVDILDIEEGEAETAACSVEHVVSKDIVDKLAAFVKKTKKNREK